MDDNLKFNPSVNKKVIVTPNEPGTTLTIRGDHSATGQNLGKINKGEIYMALYEIGGFYSLAPIDTPFPSTVPAGSEVFADMRFLPFYTEPTPPPVVVDPPVIQPVSDDWVKALILEIGRAIVRVLE